MRILIVGAGPVGCYTAQLLKERGYHSVLLEEHASLGKPVHCAGIISSDLLTILQPLISDGAVKSIINEFSINTPWEGEFSICKSGVAAVLDREKFDSDLGKGLDVHLGERICSIEKNNNRYKVRTEQGKEYEADLLIGADGAGSMVRKFLLQNYGKKGSIANIGINYYTGMQYRIRLHNSAPEMAQDSIKVFFNSDIHFFIWMIKEDSYIIRIGVIHNQNKDILDNFTRKEGIKGEIIDIIPGRIPLGLLPTYNNQIALVGDAACQVKPLTGGGLSFGLQSARILADCIREGKLEQYDSRWKKKFGPEIRFGMKARKIYENLNYEQRREVFKIFRKNSDFIEMMVDYDHHSKLFREAFRKPQILLDAGKLFSFYLEDLVSEFIS
ncbi:MAG TPA: NAD(P)/FAD-dependent oxidoreductase [Atribacterota bacterium]|nr:NAD(P)/FAD-dependent oxidoreductase [Atribacterota bacterium]